MSQTLIPKDNIPIINVGKQFTQYKIQHYEKRIYSYNTTIIFKRRNVVAGRSFFVDELREIVYRSFILWNALRYQMDWFFWTSGITRSINNNSRTIVDTRCRIKYLDITQQRYDVFLSRTKHGQNDFSPERCILWEHVWVVSGSLGNNNTRICLA